MRATITILLLAQLLAPQQQSPNNGSTHREPSSPTGRTVLHYGVEWKLIRAGIARASWTPAPQGGAWQADLHLESTGVVSKLYRVYDDYTALMNEELCVSSAVLKAEEGKRRRETHITFDRQAGKAFYHERDLMKNTTVLSKEIEIPPCVHEVLGGVMKLRSLNLQPGQSAVIPLSDGKKFARVKIEAQEREEVKTPLGTFPSIRHEVHMFNGVVYPRRARCFIWISDDERRLPVQVRLRMQFLIGAVTLQLEKEERL